MFITVLLRIAKTWKQPEYPSTDEWIKRTVGICTMEYYSAIQNEEIYHFLTVHMALGGIMLSKIKSETNNYMVSLICRLLKRKRQTKLKSWKKEIRLEVTGGGDWRQRKLKEGGQVDF